MLHLTRSTRKANISERNIEYTQYAYGIDGVDRKTFKASSDLDSTDISNNMDTISNIRINDYDPAKTYYNQLQNIKQYYNFNDVNVDRYMVNGKYTPDIPVGKGDR